MNLSVIIAGIISLAYVGFMSSQPFSFEALNELNISVKAPEYFKTHDGIKLAYYSYVPEHAKRMLIFYHGGGVYQTNLYHAFAQQLESLGVATILVDIRGHGYSEGARGDAPSTQQVWHDVHDMVDFMHQQYPDKQLLLGGHSSGAGLVLNALHFKSNEKVKGLVLLAPFLGNNADTAKKLDDQQRFVKKVQILPLALHANSGYRWFKHSPAIFFNYPEQVLKQDPKILSYYTCAMAAATTPDDAKKIFQSLKMPFCMIIGSDDEQFVPQKVVAYRNLAPKESALSEAVVIPSATHLNILLKSSASISQWIEKLS